MRSVDMEVCSEDPADLSLLPYKQRYTVLYLYSTY